MLQLIDVMRTDTPTALPKVITAPPANTVRAGGRSAHGSVPYQPGNTYIPVKPGVAGSHISTTPTNPMRNTLGAPPHKPGLTQTHPVYIPGQSFGLTNSTAFGVVLILSLATFLIATRL